jgi:uncharacterized peroxidase-related enzyme
MAFIETISPNAAEGDVEAMYRRQQAAWGYIPNYAKVFSVRPEVLARWGQLLAEMRRPMDKRRFELITFVASVALGNTACALVHGRALTEFFSDAQILAIAEGRYETVLSEAEQALTAFARQTIVDATQTKAEQVAALKRHGYSDGEIFDIAAVAAGRAYFAKLLDALGTLPDSPLLAMDESFRRALTIGRPIDQAACVTMEMPQPFDR